MHSSKNSGGRVMKQPLLHDHTEHAGSLAGGLLIFLLLSLGALGCSELTEESEKAPIKDNAPATASVSVPPHDDMRLNKNEDGVKLHSDNAGAESEVPNAYGFPQARNGYFPIFTTDGRGGLYFEDALRTQTEYPGLTDCIIQGGAEPNIFYIIHYPQELAGRLGAHISPDKSERADASVLRFVQQHAAEYILAGGVPRKKFFSGSFADLKTVEAYEKDEEALLREEGITREEYLAGSDRRIFPVFITYELTEAPQALSLNFKFWAYTGGAHDNWRYAALSIDKKNGEIITLKDLFKAPGSLEHTETWLNTTEDAGFYFSGSCMTEKSELERTGIDLNSADMADKGLTMERIILTPNGLEVVFAPYEQGSFAMGDVHAPVSLQTIRKLGINGSYWKK